MRRLGPTEIAALPRGDLVSLWRNLFEGSPPRQISAPLMRRVLAFEIQARGSGGVNAKTRRALQRTRMDAVRQTGPQLRPGARLVREWHGTLHVVEVVEGGFDWRGRRWRSLSAIARAITGARWSGPRFFGLADHDGDRRSGSAS